VTGRAELAGRPQSLVRGERVRVEERQRPYVDLLDEFVIAQRLDVVALRRVRQHAAEIAEWFADVAGLTLHLTPSSARLVREADRATPAHGFGWAESPLDYELVAWVLWFQETLPGDQFVLSELAERVRVEAAARRRGEHLDWKNMTHRRALVRTLTNLVSMGFLVEYDADLDGYVQDGRGNALYGFTDVARRFVVPDVPEGVRDHADARREWAERGAPAPAATDLQRAYRALLLQSVFYEADDPDAFAALVTRDNRKRAEQEFGTRLGWHLEITRRYAALLRPAAAMYRDTVFPPRAPLPGSYHVLLLTLSAIRDAATGESPSLSLDEATETIVVPEWRLMDLVRTVRKEFGEHWGTTLGAMGVESLTKEVIARMREWAMLEGPDDSGRYRILPLAGRYRGCYVSHALGGDGEQGHGSDEGIRAEAREAADW
jgi:uncharacterized protein (TIGR02678 family)